jgi:patatin-related protein
MATSPKAEYKQETRFAVVMYGGVSLAIYINGIAQELFHLVSSTARESTSATTALPVAELTPTQRVYRKLSYILSNREFRRSCRKEADEKAKQKLPYTVPDAPEDDTIETRFVIDIMSGTSAGGINSIFLAKALANDQNIDQLKELWINEGDIELLLNDKRSVEGIGLKKQHPPLSLLNSRRMYLKLLKAFDDMEKAKPSARARSRFLDDNELDLFITTTDITGLPLPIRLSDSVVFERRHRNVFRFRYSPDDDAYDFLSKHNPFLAFAARCTSSFPFAFEPMKLSDIDEVLETFPEYRADPTYRGASDEWRRFFNRNVRAADRYIENRAFGDGGYLDNKPFSYAVDTISRRHSTLPVDRKLIYIEPSPEHPETDNPTASQIDALQNVKAAILELPMYETIREDLQRVMERNNLINRVNEITDAIEQDLDDAGLQRPTLQSEEWERLDLAGMVQRFGIYYIPYRRLRIEAASDELARTVARLLTLDEDAAEYIAVRALIHAWREKTYKDESQQRRDEPLETLAEDIAAVTANQASREQIEEVETKLRSWLQLNCSDAYKGFQSDGKTTAPHATKVKTINQFLLHYDFKYWLRRITFVRAKIDQLLQLHKVPVINDLLDASEKQKEIVARLNKFLGSRKYEQLLPKEKLEIKDSLSSWRVELIKLYKTVRDGGRDILSPSRTAENSKEREFAAQLSKITLSKEILGYLLGTVDKKGESHKFSKLKVEECAKRAVAILYDAKVAEQFNAKTLAEDLEAAANTLRDILTNMVKETWKKCARTWGPDDQRAPSSEYIEGVRKYVWHYLSKFDDYDQVRFPIMYGTDGNESDVVEVFRISPEDAPHLINERDESTKPNGRTKLAGTSLHHFGAFLDRVWRQNDIMWGRLDGAERLITMLLPYYDDVLVRNALIKEAHAAILREELSTESRSQLSTLMSEALIRASTGEPIEEAINKVIRDLTDSSPVKTRLASAITAIFDDDVTKTDDEKLVKFVQLGYRVNRRLDPQSVLETISRSTQTIGGIFEDLANKNGLDGRSLSWIARLGQFFWGLVQVAVPGGLLNKFLTHWLYLLYAFEAFIVIAGIVLSRPGAQQFGLTAFAVTAIVNVLTLLLKDLMRGRDVVWRALLVLGGVVIGALTVIGFFKLIGILGARWGDPARDLTPLSWISLQISNALQLARPIQSYALYIIGALVVIVLVILNRLGKLGSGQSTPKKRKFKSIRLERFKQEDMKDIYRREQAGVATYSVPARLSSAPPLDWIKTFNDQWTDAHPQTRVRIYNDLLRFDSDAKKVKEIWTQLQKIVASTNQLHSQAVRKENEDLDQRLKNEEQRKKQEKDEKWATFGELD